MTRIRRTKQYWIDNRDNIDRLAKYLYVRQIAGIFECSTSLMYKMIRKLNIVPYNRRNAK